MTIQTQTISDIERMTIVTRVTWVGLVCNLVLSLLKCCLGYLGSSHAVIADGIHSLSDLITDLAILIGVKYWSAPPDEKHPYGHYQYETIISSLIGLILITAAILLGYSALSSIRGTSEQTHPTWLAAVAALISVVVKEVLYRWTMQKGTAIKSSSLVANAQHHRSDALSSLPVLAAVSVAIFYPNWDFIDQIGALFVSLFILKAGYNIIAQAVSELIDASAPAEDCDRIKELVLSVDKVQSAHKIRTRRVGYGIFLDLHIQVNGDMTVTEGHIVSHKVSSTLYSLGPDVIDVIVHLEPYNKGQD